MIVLSLLKSWRKALDIISAFGCSSFSLFQSVESRSEILLSQVQQRKLSCLEFPSNQNLLVSRLVNTCFTHSLDPTNQDKFDDHRINYYRHPIPVDKCQSINVLVTQRNYKVHNAMYQQISKCHLNNYGAQLPLDCIQFQHQCGVECVFLIHPTISKMIHLSLFVQASLIISFDLLVSVLPIFLLGHPSFTDFLTAIQKGNKVLIYVCQQKY